MRCNAGKRDSDPALDTPVGMTGHALANPSMLLVSRYAFLVLWLSWGLYWWAASRNVKAVVRRESLPLRLMHIVPLAVAVALLWDTNLRGSFLTRRLWDVTEWMFWSGLLLTAAGLMFSVWARVHLGRNWSGIVTIKQGHELITSGPYALVRHPIYTGLLLGFIGSAMAIGEWRGVVAVVLVAVSFWFKLRREERWMRQQFGQAYSKYAERVSALVPFIL